jgi:hypothetical protein
MKTRNSFVANSSSSSFIIAYRDVSAVTANVEPKWVKLMVDKMIGAVTRDGEVISTVEALDRYFINMWGGRDDTIEDIFEKDEDLKERYDKMVLALEAGFILSDVDVDNHDEWSGEFFSSLPDNDLTEPMTLIYSCN